VNRRVIQALALLALGLLILYGVLRSVHPAQVAHALQRATPGWILLGAAAYAAFILVRAWRWQLILEASARGVRLADTTAVTAVGFAVNSVSPFKLGELVRIAAIAPRARIGIGEAGATVVLERVLDVLALLVLAVAAAAVSGSASRGAGLWTGVVLFAIVSLGIGVVAYRMVSYPDRTRQVVAALAGRLPSHLEGKANDLGSSVIKGFTALRSPGRLAATGGLSLLTWLCIVLGLIAFFRAVSTQLSVPTLFLACTIFVVSQAVSITPGSVGTYEGFFLLVLSTFGAGPPALVTAAAVLGHISNVVVLLVAGAVGALYLRINPGRLPVGLERPTVSQDRA
jgi:glycosyltransferase 2 family protein